jgi:peptidoglycan LD-endopeptidase CwlK
MYDPTLSHLANLVPKVRTPATYLVIAARNAGVPLIITSSRRTTWEQVRLYLAGRTRTLNSAHLRGEAFDIDVVGWQRDAIPTPFWDAVGEYGEGLGLAWGGRFKSIYDPGHFELRSA